jgi:rod shape-determining protein MreC
VTTGRFFNTLDSAGGRLFGLVRAEGENVILREQNAQLSKREVERDALEDENNRLRTLLNLKEQKFPKGIGAEVLGRDMRDWFHAVSINRGTADGVNNMAAVVTGNSERPTLIGRVVEAKDNISKVLLLTDSLSAVSVVIVRTGDMGLLEGQNKPWIKVNYLPHLATLQVGDQIVTAGLGGIFPPGLPIGEITKISESSDGFFKEVVVTPYVNMSNLREVLVLERRESLKPEPMAEVIKP